MLLQFGEKPEGVLIIAVALVDEDAGHLCIAHWIPSQKAVLVRHVGQPRSNPLRCMPFELLDTAATVTARAACVVKRRCHLVCPVP